jgi:hypothetical protein
LRRSTRCHFVLATPSLPPHCRRRGTPCGCPYLHNTPLAGGHKGRPYGMQSRSRGARAPKFCLRHFQHRPAEPDRVTPKPVVERAFGSILLNGQKASGTPAGALVQPPRHTGAARAKRRALAFRRSTTALAAATERHRSAPVNAFLGRNEVGTGVTRSRPSTVQRVPPQTGRSAGRAYCPGAARERR